MTAKKTFKSFIKFSAAFLVIMCLAGCAGCGGGGGSSAATSRTDVTITNSDGDSYKVSAELAITDEQHETGLMNRTALEDNQGMLFVFDDEATRSFWMKNTLIPLDMVFISSGKTIVDIRRNAQPGDLTPYQSASPAKYVLEVNGGWCDRRGILVGDPVDFEGF